MKVVEVRIGQVQNPLQRDGLYGPDSSVKAVTYICQERRGTCEAFGFVGSELVSRNYLWGMRNARALLGIEGDIRAEAELVAEYMRTCFSDIVDEVVIDF